MKTLASLALVSCLGFAIGCGPEPSVDSGSTAPPEAEMGNYEDMMNEAATSKAAPSETDDK
jgi:hypothetical protein